MTVIPDQLASFLDLESYGDVKAGGFNGRYDYYPGYVVNIKIDDMAYKYIKVIASSRSNILIGRDLINCWRMELDGWHCTGKIIL